MLNPFIEHSRDVFLALDREWRLLYVNRPAERFLGQARADLLGRSLWDVRADARGTPFEEHLEQAMASQRALTFEEEYAPFRLHLGVYAVPVPEGLYVYCRDLTSERRAESALRKSHAIFNALVEGTTDAVYTKDLAGRYTCINGAGARMMGFAPHEVMGRLDVEIWGAKGARETLASDRNVLHTGRTFTFEEAWPGEAAEWVQTTKGVLRDERGQPMGLFGIARDVSERKRVEAALQAGEERVQWALRAAGMMVWDLDLASSTLSWMPGASGFLGAPDLGSHEPLQEFLQRVHPQDRAELQARMSVETLVEGGPICMTFRTLDAQGRTRRFELRAEALVEHGRPLRLTGMLSVQAADNSAVEAA